MKKYVFGVDVGGTTVKMGLFNVDGEVLDKWEIKTRTENGGEAILPDIAASALAKLEEKGIAKEEVAGVGIGIATAKATEAIARQPEAKKDIRSAMLLGCVLAEATAIYGFVIALLIIVMLGGK